MGPRTTHGQRQLPSAHSVKWIKGKRARVFCSSLFLQFKTTRVMQPGTPKAREPLSQ